LADFTRDPDQYEPVKAQPGQLDALRLAIGERAELSTNALGQEASDAISRVREVADYLRVADERISDLEAGLQAITERARRDLKAAQERAEQAETRVSAETARADAAERRAREAEEQLSKIMTVIEEELVAGRAAQG
jgi:vacuolar-type H+-ATPase subunit I/STV1